MPKLGGIDVGGTSIKYGLVLDHTLTFRNSVITPKNQDDIRNILKEIVTDLIEEGAEGIGIGFPGYIEQSQGRFIWGPNLQFEIDVAKLMNELNFSNFKIDNDANLAALAEYENYYKKRVKHLIFLSFGTGIGGGIIDNSLLIRGHGNAGELGHIFISNEHLNVSCSCGKVGCLESLASAQRWTQIVEELIKQDPKSRLSELNKNKIKGSTLFTKDHNLTENQINERDKIIDYISKGLVSLYEIFDNEVFVLGGTFTDDSTYLIELLIKRIEYLYEDNVRAFPVVALSKLKSNAGILGAAYLLEG